MFTSNLCKPWNLDQHHNCWCSCSLLLKEHYQALQWLKQYLVFLEIAFQLRQFKYFRTWNLGLNHSQATKVTCLRVLATRLSMTEPRSSCSKCTSSMMSSRTIWVNAISPVLLRVTTSHFSGVVTNIWKQPGVGVTEDLFDNFFTKEIVYLVNIHVKVFQSLSYLTPVTAAELRRLLSIMNVIDDDWWW